MQSFYALTQGFDLTESLENGQMGLKSSSIRLQRLVSRMLDQEGQVECKAIPIPFFQSKIRHFILLFFSNHLAAAGNELMIPSAVPSPRCLDYGAFGNASDRDMKIPPK